LRDQLSVMADPEALKTVEGGYEEGVFTEAMSRLSERMAGRSAAAYALPFDLARNYVMAPKNQQALDWLQRGFEEGDPNMPYIGLTPVFDGLHDEPRFRDLLLRLNFPADVRDRYLDEYQK